jgi:hypothetical protein
VRSSNHSLSQQADVKAQFTGPAIQGLLLRSQQIEPQSGDISVIQDAGYESIAPAIAAASTTVRE